MFLLNKKIIKGFTFFDKRGKFCFLFFLIISVFLIFLSPGVKKNIPLQGIFLLVTAVSLFGMFGNYDNLKYSVNKTFFIFHFFFFGLAPIIQFKNDITFFGATPINDNIYIQLGILLVCIQLIYLAAYIFFKKNSFAKITSKLVLGIPKFNYKILLSISVFSLFFFIYLIKFDWDVIFIKPGYQWQKNNTNMGLLGYAFLLIVRPIPLISFLLYKLTIKKESFLKDLLLLLIVLVVVFPTSLPRATIAAYYLPIIISYLNKYIKKHYYVVVFLFLFLILFPLFNFFRNYKISDIEFGLNFLCTAHLDAFHNFAQLYSQQIVTNGKQFIGSVFFFIPESIWEGKPLGTGQMMAEINNYSYTNISMPLWGEGYTNFSFLGIFLMVFFMGIFNAILDSFVDCKKFITGKILFLFFLGYEFYLLRGDLFSSFKKLFGFVLAMIIVFVVIRLLTSFFSLVKA